MADYEANNLSTAILLVLNFCLGANIREEWEWKKDKIR